MTEVREPQPTNVPDGKLDEGVSLFWFAAVLLRERKLIMVITATGIVVSMLIAVIRPRVYTASFAFVPKATQDQTRGELANLAGQFGVNLGTLGGADQPPQLYVDLLLTREVLGPIAVDSFTVAQPPAPRVPLPELLDVHDHNPAVLIEKTLRELRAKVVSVGIADRATGMIVVSVRTRSAQASLEISDKLLAGLNRFNLVTRQSQARTEREFTEDRLESAHTSLRASEGALQTFLEKNRVLSSSPNLVFERDRLQREVTIQQQFYTALAQQYERARLMEVRDTPVITMIESPVLPARPDSRKLLLMMLVGGLVAGILGTLTAFIREAVARAKRESSEDSKEFFKLVHEATPRVLRRGGHGKSG